MLTGVVPLLILNELFPIITYPVTRYPVTFTVPKPIQIYQSRFIGYNVDPLPHGFPKNLLLLLTPLMNPRYPTFPVSPGNPTGALDNSTVVLNGE